MTGMPMSRARSCVYSVCLSAVFLSLLAPCHSSGTSNQPLYLSTVQSQLLLDLHNSLRSAVTPPSANMQGLYWDNDLATAAATLAATCPTATSASSTTASTNIAYIPPFAADGTQGTIAQLPISNAVTAWTAPAVYYNFNANTCGSTGGCLSWLNLIYAPSYTVGCGLSSQQCSSVPVTYANGSELISSGYSIVCMYAKGGASTASQPYVAGLSCGGCPANFASCSSPSTCVSSGGTCPALCAVQGGLGSGLAGTIVGVVIGFLLLVVLSIYGYSVYWWREHGLYGNVKPTYKYTKAVAKDDDDGNITRAIADAPLASRPSSLPLTHLKPITAGEPASPLPIATPIKPPPVPSTLAASITTAATATVAPPAATKATPTSPPTKPKPSATSTAPAKSTFAVGKSTTHPPPAPIKTPVSPSGVHITTNQHDTATGKAGGKPSTPKSPKSPKSDTALPEGWGLHKDGSGNQYYFNTTTGQSQWSKPSK